MLHSHNIIDTDNRLYIDPITRVIKDELHKVKPIQNDHNAARISFELPRFVEGHDMTLCDRIEIHYINFASNTEKSEDVYLVDDMRVSPYSTSTAIFSWLLSANATKYAGPLNFLICFICLEGEKVIYAWHTDICKDISVCDGINNSAAAIEMGTDVLEAWKKEVLYGTEEAAKRAEEAAAKVVGASPYISLQRVEGGVKLTVKNADGTEMSETVYDGSGGGSDDGGSTGGGSTGGGTEPDPGGGTEPDPGGGTEPDPGGGTEPDPGGGTEPEYKEMTVSLSINKSSYTEYAGSVKGVELTWSVSEKASSIILTLPNGTEVDLTSDTSPYKDPNEYFITEKKTWKLTATREDGRTETKSTDVSVDFNTYRVYWGVGKPEDRTDKDFMKEVNENYDEAFVIGLKTSQTDIEGSQTISDESKRSGKFAFGPMYNQYAYFATPQKLWETNEEPTLQMGEFPIPGGFQDKKDVTFTRGAEKITYYLYRSTHLLEDDESDTLYVT